MDLFLLKKIISALLMPLSMVFVLLLIALVCFTYKRRTSFIALSLATLILFLSSFSPVSDRLMHPLEETYPAFTRSAVPVDYIIVLGCYHQSNDALPATSQLKPCSLERIVEAVRIAMIHPEAQLITSGYHGGDDVSNAEKVKQAAILLGINENRILTENFPQDTAEEAELIAPRVIGKHVVLVTNAYHLPRAMQYFIQQGVVPIPAPASPWVKNMESKKSWKYYLPLSEKLTQTTRAWHEALGQIVQWLTN